MSDFIFFHKTSLFFVESKTVRCVFWWFLLVFGEARFLPGARVKRAETMRGVVARRGPRLVPRAGHHSALIASFTGERALFPQLPIGHAFLSLDAANCRCPISCSGKLIRMHF